MKAITRGDARTIGAEASYRSPLRRSPATNADVLEVGNRREHHVGRQRARPGRIASWNYRQMEQMSVLVEGYERIAPENGGHQIEEGRGP